MGLFAGLCVDVTLIRFTLRLLVACLGTDHKQVSWLVTATVESLDREHFKNVK